MNKPRCAAPKSDAPAYAPQNACFNRGRRQTLGLIAAAAVAALASWERPAMAERVRPFKLIAFGDSLVAGYGLAEPEGFVPQLQTWLRANGAAPIVVGNAGVSGDTTSGGLARLDWVVTPDVDAVILELGANDMLRGVDPKIARANLDQMLTRLGEKNIPVLLAAMPSLGNWGDDYKRAFEAIYPDLAAKHDVPLLSFLGGVAGEQGLNQPDGIHPNAKGVARMVELLGPQIRDFVRSARATKAEATD